MQPEAVDKGMAFPSRAGASDAGRGLMLCYNGNFCEIIWARSDSVPCVSNPQVYSTREYE
jgi:hypothetical protein